MDFSNLGASTLEYDEDYKITAALLRFVAEVTYSSLLKFLCMQGGRGPVVFLCVATSEEVDNVVASSHL